MGALADVLTLHTRYYGEHWGFGLQFETLVAAEMAQFLRDFDATLDRFQVAYDGDGQCLGSISINGFRTAPGTLAQLRWFIVHPDQAGRGLGRRLLREAVHWSDTQHIRELQLSTFAGLDAARALYESTGFRLVEEQDANPWGDGVRLQRFARHAPGDTSAPVG
ncbi:MAG: GNAT family N-acetyltransferase [Pseudomonadota bacterium]